MIRARVAFGGLLLSAFSCVPSWAQFVSTEHPVAPGQVRFGLSNAQSGRIGASGASVKQGYLAYFTKINRQGGVSGRKVDLIDYDDYYQPLKAIANTEQLINSEKVLALVGYVGASSSEAVLSMVEGARLIFFAPVSGASRLREPPPWYVFNLRASYLDESRLLIKRLVEDAHVSRIALIRRQDEDGASAHEAVQAALAERSLPLVSEADYVRNTMEAQEVFDQVRLGEPEAVILCGTYAPCAQFIEYARRQHGRPLILCCTSTVSMEQVQRLLGPKAEGVVGSQVVPSPLEPASELVRDYQNDMSAMGRREFDHASLEGYVAARVLVAALQQAGPTLSEQSLREALARGTFAFGPLTFSFDRSLRESNHKVFLTHVLHGRLVPTQQIGPIGQ